MHHKSKCSMREASARSKNAASPVSHMISGQDVVHFRSTSRNLNLQRIQSGMTEPVEHCDERLWKELQIWPSHGRSCCIFPYMHMKPTPLNWLAESPGKVRCLYGLCALKSCQVTSDVWEKLEGPILGLLASKAPLGSRKPLCFKVRSLLCVQDHLMNETEVAQLGLHQNCSRAMRFG